MGRGDKIALFMPSFRRGGAERVMVNLARAFAGQGLDVDVVVAQNEGPSASLDSQGLNVVDLRSRRLLSSLPGLVRYLKRESPRVMLSALPHVNVIAVLARALARTPTRVVLSEHVNASVSAAQASRLRARALPFFMRLAYPQADAIVAVSDGVADDLATFIRVDRARITRIYNPIVSPRLLELAGATVEHPWFAPGQPPVVLGAGRLTLQKDFANLLRAFAAIRSRRPARLVLLGEGNERRNLESLAEELGVRADFALLGDVDNPFRYMARAAVFVLSSRWEGFGNVLVEAMACGTPVVSTDCPSGPGEILEGGRYGTLVAVAEPAALAQAIEAQLDSPVRSRAVDRAGVFSTDAACKSYRAVLQA